jgi:phosphohistidine phosphatase
MIWLLRHADAEQGSPDEERRLTAKGEQQARAAGAALSKLGVKPDVCLTSPKVRAVQTAELACEPLGVEVRLESRLAGGSFDANALAAGHGSVLLVGHEPDCSDVVEDLTGGRVDMKKGGIAGVEDAELRVLLRPKEIKAIAK